MAENFALALTVDLLAFLAFAAGLAFTLVLPFIFALDFDFALGLAGVFLRVGLVDLTEVFFAEVFFLDLAMGF
uniref:hypothetical protein n=1 Tax=Cephaloticoccus sp. TaxID=1985742 RepID=UPI00404A86B5